jgi:hypothetical protein
VLLLQHDLSSNLFGCIALSIEMLPGKTGRGLVLIPGLGRVDRLQHVVYNLGLLEPFLSEKGGWDCVVYIYASRPFSGHSVSETDAAFWAAEQRVRREYVSQRCHVVENPGALVTQNLRLVQPHLLRLVYSHVLVRTPSVVS